MGKRKVLFMVTVFLLLFIVEIRAYAHSPGKILIVTDSREIQYNTEILEYCEGKNLKYRYLDSIEEYKDFVKYVYEEDIEKIVYIHYENERALGKIILGLNEEIEIESYKVTDLSFIEEIIYKLYEEERVIFDDESINVVNKNEYTPYWIYSSPDYSSSKVGYVYGSLTEVKVIEELENFYKIQTIRYSDKKSMEGYIPKKDVISKKLDNEYRVIVDIESQVIDVYHNGYLEREIICSTGLGGNFTPKGRYLIGSRGKSFGDLYNYTCYNWVRFNNNYLFHSVLFNKDGSINKKEAKKLGSPASHGCIRMALEDSKWFYDTIPSGSLVEIK